MDSNSFSYDPAKGPPYVPPELVAYLKTIFRDQLPTGQYDLRGVDRQVGQQDVIRFLAQRVKVQLEKQMER